MSITGGCIQVIMWNVGKTSADRSFEAIGEINQSGAIHLLQEVDNWPSSITRPGFDYVREADSQAGILIPFAFLPCFTFRAGTPKTASVLLDFVGLVAGYLADSWKTAEDYEITLLELTGALRLL